MIPLAAFLGALLIMGAIVAFLSWIQYRERRELYDRIQAGSLVEYQSVTTGKKEPATGRSHSQKVLKEQGVELP